jgi:hypothetical protein
MNTTSLIIVALVLAFIMTATAQRLPLPKIGQCPSGVCKRSRLMGRHSSAQKLWAHGTLAAGDRANVLRMARRWTRHAF